jgi:hypothetical protein
MVVLAAATLAGSQVARAGFAWLRPIPVVEEEIARDPASPIALAHEIARKNRTTPGAPAAFLALIALVPAAVMVGADPRRRPVAASVAWAGSLFIVHGVILARSPAFRSLVPGAGETVVALAITAGAAVLGGLAARRLADLVATRSPEKTRPVSAAA